MNHLKANILQSFHFYLWVYWLISPIKKDKRAARPFDFSAMYFLAGNDDFFGLPEFTVAPFEQVNA